MEMWMEMLMERGLVVWGEVGMAGGVGMWVERLVRV